MSEETVVGLILSKLPASTYGPLTTIFDTMEVLPYDTLKEKVRIFYKRRIAKLDGSVAAEDSSKAFMAGAGRHLKNEHWKARVKCFRCKKVGHVKKGCPFLKGTSKPLDPGTKGGGSKAAASTSWKGGNRQQGKAGCWQESEVRQGFYWRRGRSGQR